MLVLTEVKDKWYWTSLSFKSTCPIIVAGIYCVPDFIAEMDSKLETLIENIYVWSKEAPLLGDFNINKSGGTSTITS